MARLPGHRLLHLHAPQPPQQGNTPVTSTFGNFDTRVRLVGRWLLRLRLHHMTLLSKLACVNLGVNPALRRCWR
eukprot:scaffold68352_cov18-Tisochrysis_lutea.AAC.2